MFAGLVTDVTGVTGFQEGGWGGGGAEFGVKSEEWLAGTLALPFGAEPADRDVRVTLRAGAAV